MPIWITPLEVEEVNRRAKDTLSHYLGIEFTEVGENSLTAKMPVDARTRQPHGLLHGGASCALAETVGSAAANYCVDQRRQICVGLDIHVNHLRPVRTGIVTAVAKPIHLGKKTQVWEIQIHDEQKKLISISCLTMAILEKDQK